MSDNKNDMTYKSGNALASGKASGLRKAVGDKLLRRNGTLFLKRDQHKTRGILGYIKGDIFGTEWKENKTLLHLTIH